MTWTAFPEAQNITSIYDLLVYANRPDVTGGVFGLTISFTVFTIVLIQTYGRQTMEDSIMWAAFMTTVTSLFLRILSLIGDEIWATFALITILALVASAFKKKTYGE